MSHLTAGQYTSCTCATEQWKWADGDTDCAVWFLNCVGLSTSSTISNDDAVKSNCLGENYEWYTTIYYHSLFFFHLFHIVSYKKSVSNWHQSEVWKKTSTSSQTTSKCTIPLSSPSSSSSSLIRLSDSLNPPSEECSTLLVFSKQKNKTAEGSYLCSK